METFDSFGLKDKILLRVINNWSELKTDDISIDEMTYKIDHCNDILAEKLRSGKVKSINTFTLVHYSKNSDEFLTNFLRSTRMKIKQLEIPDGIQPFVEDLNFSKELQENLETLIISKRKIDQDSVNLYKRLKCINLSLLKFVEHDNCNTIFDCEKLFDVLDSFDHKMSFIYHKLGFIYPKEVNDRITIIFKEVVFKAVGSDLRHEYYTCDTVKLIYTTDDQFAINFKVSGEFLYVTNFF